MWSLKWGVTVLYLIIFRISVERYIQASQSYQHPGIHGPAQAYPPAVLWPCCTGTWSPQSVRTILPRGKTTESLWTDSEVNFSLFCKPNLLSEFFSIFHLSMCKALYSNMTHFTRCYVDALDNESHSVCEKGEVATQIKSTLQIMGTGEAVLTGLYMWHTHICVHAHTHTCPHPRTRAHTHTRNKSVHIAKDSKCIWQENMIVLWCSNLYTTSTCQKGWSYSRSLLTDRSSWLSYCPWKMYSSLCSCSSQECKKKHVSPAEEGQHKKCDRQTTW